VALREAPEDRVAMRVSRSSPIGHRAGEREKIRLALVTFEL
jgi:hypothetical protein